MELKQCSTCLEAWPVKKKKVVKKKILKTKMQESYYCTQCKSDKKYPKKFSLENNMIPSQVPVELRGLTQCEEILIRQHFKRLFS